MNSFRNPDDRKFLIEESTDYPFWVLNDKQICDLELILNGGFYPLNGFLNKIDYNSVLENKRLSNGSLWPIPVTLDVDRDLLDITKNLEYLTLKDKEGFPLAILKVEDIWKPDIIKEANCILKTADPYHPHANYLLKNKNRLYVGGKLKKISLPNHHDFKEIRHTASQLKSIIKKNKWEKVVAFQTRNPMHRAHFEMTLNAINDFNAKLLIPPVAGVTKPGDVDYFTRVRCYNHVLKKYPKNTAMLSLIPLAMRMAGPREALWHALIRKNFGCSHIIIGRDHAGPGKNKEGKDFYGQYDAQELVKEYESEIGIKMIPFSFMVYLPKHKVYKSIDELEKNTEIKNLSGTDLRNLLKKGKGIPRWFTFKNVSKELEASSPPITKRGFTVFFTGLSGSGKSTLANGLLMKLLEYGTRPVTLLDGDIVRRSLSSELGFSKRHRSLNVQRIGFVASEITKNNGIAICAPIAPYESDRLINRKLIEKFGGYIEVYVNTPLKICEKRDPKGLYKLAKEGKIKEFTGISDPYEKPYNSEIIIDTSIKKPDELINKIYYKIVDLGYVKN